MRLRLVDIAARAGVSEATVSRVLNDKPVTELTRERVLTAIDVLGYERPARLRRKPAGLVGLVVPELVNPVFPLFAQLIETALVKHGYTPVLCTQTPGGVHEDDYVQMLLERGAAGIIFVSGIHAITQTDTERYSRLLSQGVPIVLVNGFQADVRAPNLSQDDTVAVDLAVRHLYQLGHRRIGLALGPRRYTPVSRRIAAFDRLALELTDMVPLVECSQYSVEGGASAAHALIDQHATGIVCGSDLMALGAIRSARLRGLRVPQDVSVVGSDDGLLAQFADPPLTTVRQDVAGMSAAAVRALLEEITGTPSPHNELLFPPELVVRASTAAPGTARRGTVGGPVTHTA
ncbi:LacI family DNA-binding transcriptional regulator [Actinotalea sp.]|uniref:LacI family DNA-binding transcriptional regulator n=1 Tax=Actinotalea sp. TaxID=1872145 RepID=UPI002C193D1C|nr:LacI family DNA-binding transcriptional regulator [Actinotalea sp.]HQY34034.1 LacI family DNA-binding transcriptional regulator [Actinotalea sp.]HRA50366.1 LacI family DNA-binding transcriptional regulator [Actinotalea sp.]